MLVVLLVAGVTGSGGLLLSRRQGVAAFAFRGLVLA